MPAKPKMPKSPRGKKGVDLQEAAAAEEPKGKGKASTPAKPAAAQKKAAAPVKSSGPRGAKYDEFATSADVMWMLTKKWNSHMVKFNQNWGKKATWSKSPFSQSGFHNASSSANTIGVVGTKELNDKKNVRRVFTLTLKHKRRNGISKRKAGSQSKPCYSVHEVRREVNHTAKTIQALSWADAQEKKRALQRLSRASRAMKSSIKGAAKAE